MSIELPPWLRAEVVRDEVVGELADAPLGGAGELLVAVLGEGEREADVALEGRRAIALDVLHHRVQLAGHERVRVQEGRPERSGHSSSFNTAWQFSIEF